MTFVPRFTPGRFTALWVVLRSASKLSGVVDREELLSFARTDGLRCGGLPVKDGYQLALLGGFVSGEEKITLTDLGHEALRRGSEDEPSREALRLFASVFFLRYPPAWVAYWQGDPSSLELVLPEAARDVLQGADLLGLPTPEDLEAWALWDALKEVPPVEDLANQRSAIGDAAEELSFWHEQERLKGEGYPHLAARVRWVAKESPAYGFDILSFCGSTHRSASAELPLAIEVKGQAIKAHVEFTFYLTSHEWRTALVLRDQYVFHLWDGVRLRALNSPARSEPLLVSPTALVNHIPSPPKCGSECGWRSAVITLSLQG